MDSKERRERGQALVEFALVFPIFLVLVFGLIDVGRLVYVDNALSQAAREGARWGSVPNWLAKATAEGLTCSTREQCVAAHTLKVMAAVPSATVTATCTNLEGNATDPLGHPYTCADADQILIVSTSSPVSMLTPVIGQIVGTQTVKATSKVAVNS